MLEITAQVGAREVIQGWDKAILGDDDLPPMKVSYFCQDVLVDTQSYMVTKFEVIKCLAEQKLFCLRESTSYFW